MIFVPILKKVGRKGYQVSVLALKHNFIRQEVDSSVV